MNKQGVQIPVQLCYKTKNCIKEGTSKREDVAKYEYALMRKHNSRKWVVHNPAICPNGKIYFDPAYTMFPAKRVAKEYSLLQTKNSAICGNGNDYNPELRWRSCWLVSQCLSQTDQSGKEMRSLGYLLRRSTPHADCSLSKPVQCCWYWLLFC